MADEEVTEVELDADLALAQASNALLLATEKAEMLNDVPALMKIAGGWMEIHEYLTGQPHHNKKQPLGFAGSSSNQTHTESEKLDDAVGDESNPDSTDESDGIARIHAQHGKLRITPSRPWRGR